ncbi:AGE family epimerase/isomerase [Nitratireductor rhodophyticola]
MTAGNAFFPEAADRYASANAGTLRWMLDRPRLGAGFLNTKVNSLTLADYGEADGLRGPDYTYGWIQGRGLEALVSHAAFFETRDAALSRRLDEAGRSLFARIKALQARDGHVYFRYDAGLRPVRADADGTVTAQEPAGDVFTYSDAFAAKGLVAAAARYAPEELPGYLRYLADVIAAIEDGRFQMGEEKPLGGEALASEPDDFGPRMILLGAAGMLERCGLSDHAAYAQCFIDHVIENHLDMKTGLLRNVPGGDECNVGHGIEFAGFALDHAPVRRNPALVATLERILIASFRASFAECGLHLTVSVSSGEKLSPYRPWWSLPETIRTAALCHQLTGSADSLAIWQEADSAFFDHYWRGAPAIAYQTRTADGPTDYVPATPDLDPGYHTGLSLLAAIHVAEALSTSHPAYASR